MTRSLDLEGLSVERGGVEVVSDLHYRHEGPGWVGIVGANGSGKTSLLRAIAGRLPISGGRILLDGDEVGRDRAARARRIGFAVENSQLPGDLTPREVFAITALQPNAPEAPALAGLKAGLNLDPFLDRKCRALSAGMAQRVALFAAFLDQPPIIILDEPFNWLDPLTAYDTKQALRNLVAKEKMMLITALHDVATLTAYCDRGILMAAGRIAIALEEPDLRAGLEDPVAFEAEIVSRLRGNL